VLHPDQTLKHFHQLYVGPHSTEALSMKGLLQALGMNDTFEKSYHPVGDRYHARAKFDPQNKKGPFLSCIWKWPGWRVSKDEGAVNKSDLVKNSRSLRVSVRTEYTE
jgi:hypothetical protein